MSTHGVPRSAPTTLSPAERDKEAQKIAIYRNQEKSLHALIESAKFDPDTLALSSALLMQNPEHYTIWNHRRRILSHLLAHPSPPSPTHAPDLLQKDLEFLLPLLLKFPKCYWIWNHRLWLLAQFSTQAPDLQRAAWERELALDSKMLSKDSRNFHGWDYRRVVVAQLRAPGAKQPEHQHQQEEAAGAVAGAAAAAARTAITETEFEYTGSLLQRNLSNFSAWHARSKLLPEILRLRQHGASSPEAKQLYHTELEFLKSALLMDPYDQSLWKYHQYLVFVLMATEEQKQIQGSVEQRDAGWVAFSRHERLEILRREIAEIRELLQDTDDCKWVFLGLLELSRAYMAHAGAEEDSRADKVVTTRDMRAWLDRLVQLDPLRLGRWRDMEKSLDI